MVGRAACLVAMALIFSESAALAQMALPSGVAATPADLFRRQCGTCHVVGPGGPRQGPNLTGIIGRKAGTVPDFGYSAAFKKADFAWDEEKLDAYLANPQALVPGAVMPYRQAKAEIRQSIIQYLKGFK